MIKNFIKKCALTAFFVGSFISVSFANLPQILYEKDINNYKKIFELQKQNKLQEVKKIIPEINNDILMGYVLKNLYLSPYYKTSYDEIVKWLDNYNDLYEADKIYKLGLSKGSKHNLHKPENKIIKTKFFDEEPFKPHKMIQNTYNHLPKKQKDEINYMITVFNRRLKSGYTKNARQILENPNSKKYFYKNDYLRMQAHLAYVYFLNNENEMAILWGEKPAKELNYYFANWTLGLVYWKEKDFKKSRDYFKQVAFTKQIPSDIVSAAAFWAYRANEKITNEKDKDNSEIYLQTASSYPKTFYGLLANKELHKDVVINWEQNSLTVSDINELLSYKNGVRALAFLQLDMKEYATEELKLLLQNEATDTPDLVNAILAVAEIANLPRFLWQISNKIPNFANYEIVAAAKYPTINVSDYKIDFALLNAIIRQESKFNPMAVSPVGARGLLQIMPSTASFIMKDRKYRYSQKHKLFDENVNIEIGQIYMDYLLNLEMINGNLLKFLLAYNAGPGNLKKQLTHIANEDDDPLLFIESISLKETRIYIKRVMANFWLYQNKLGQETKTINDLLNNNWPLYMSNNILNNIKNT